MNMLEGKLALVTGAGNGIGRGVALRFACECAMEDVEAFPDEREQFVQLAEHAVLRHLVRTSPPATLRELIAAAGGKLGGWPREMDRELVYALARHMDQLTARGIVQGDSTVFPIEYRLAPAITRFGGST